MVGVTDPLWLDSPPVRFWQFLPGILVARGLVRGNAVLGVAALAGSIFVSDWRLILLLAVLGAGLVVADVVRRPIRVPGWVVYGSTISYGIYLWHHEILRSLRDLGLPPAGIVAGGIVLTAAVAASSWHLLERPVNAAAARWRSGHVEDRAPASSGGVGSVDPAVDDAVAPALVVGAAAPAGARVEVGPGAG
jgi:peptidoglycan/LPS O-acetylase OafA/YrhL